VCSRTGSGRHTWLWATVLQYCLVMMAWNGAFMVLGPAVARARLGGPAAWGAISAADALGLIAGGLIALRYTPRRPILFVVVTGGALAVSPLLLGLAAPLALICLASFALGLLAEVMMVQWTVALATRIPADKLARVSSYDAFGSLAAMPLGALVAGPLAAWAGISVTEFAAAALIVAASAATLLPREIWTIRRDDMLPGRASAPVVERERTAADHGPDREGGPRPGDPGDGEHLVQQQLLVAGQVGHRGLDEEVV
jgi:MFS family permease